MRMFKFLIIYLSLHITVIPVYSQVSVITYTFNSFDANPASLLNISVMNSGVTQKVVVSAQLLNSTGDMIMHAKTNRFLLSEGISVLNGFQLSFEEEHYGTSSQGEYVRLQRMLPSGNYSLCYQILSGYGEVQFTNCFDLASENNTVLHLVSPFDGEILSTQYPILSWFHSDPFSITDEAEFYRMIVCEIIEGMTPEASIDNNIPVFLLDYLASHQIPYSIEAIPLEPGKRYAWRVQKISRNTIIQQTETWQFSLKKNDKQQDIKYAVASRKLDGGFYTAVNNKLYFRFDESYSPGRLDCMILSNSNSAIRTQPQNEEATDSEISLKEHGYNRYFIDLDEYRLKSGIHTLKITNSKKEIFYLKFKTE